MPRHGKKLSDDPRVARITEVCISVGEDFSTGIRMEMKRKGCSEEEGSKLRMEERGVDCAGDTCRGFKF